MTTGRLHDLGAIVALSAGRLHKLSGEIPSAFVITSPDLVDLEPGTVATVNASATGGTVSTWTFALIGAPAGLSLSGSGNSRTFTVPSSVIGAISFQIDITAEGTAPTATKRISIACLPRLEWVAIGGSWSPADDPQVLGV